MTASIHAFPKQQAAHQMLAQLRERATTPEGVPFRFGDSEELSESGSLVGLEEHQGLNAEVELQLARRLRSTTDRQLMLLVRRMADRQVLDEIRLHASGHRRLPRIDVWGEFDEDGNIVLRWAPQRDDGLHASDVGIELEQTDFLSLGEPHLEGQDAHVLMVVDSGLYESVPADEMDVEDGYSTLSLDYLCGTLEDVLSNLLMTLGAFAEVRVLAWPMYQDEELAICDAEDRVFDMAALAKDDAMEAVTVGMELAHQVARNVGLGVSQFLEARSRCGENLEAMCEALSRNSRSQVTLGQVLAIDAVMPHSAMAMYEMFDQVQELVAQSWLQGPAATR